MSKKLKQKYLDLHTLSHFVLIVRYCNPISLNAKLVFFLSHSCKSGEVWSANPICYCMTGCNFSTRGVSCHWATWQSERTSLKPVKNCFSSYELHFWQGNSQHLACSFWVADAFRRFHRHLIWSTWLKVISGDTVVWGESILPIAPRHRPSHCLQWWFSKWIVVCITGHEWSSIEMWNWNQPKTTKRYQSLGKFQIFPFDKTIHVPTLFCFVLMDHWKVQNKSLIK